MRRKILHVLAPSGYGGLERVVALLMQGQSERGNLVSAATLLDFGGREPALIETLTSAGVTVTEIRHPARDYLAKMRSIRQCCDAIAPDVVHSHGYVADVLVDWSGTPKRVPVTTTVHGFTGGGLKNRVYERLQRNAFRHFQAVVAVSARLGKSLAESGIPASRIHVVPNAYHGDASPISASDARARLNVPAGRHSIGWIGRISHEKGLDVLIEALPGLKDLDWHLTIVGDGRDTARLRQRVVTLGVGERVTWAGALDAAADIIPAFDVVVLSSRTEGTPMILFEAMANGVPVVATAVGGVPDVLSPAEAVLVASEDPTSLASGVRSVLLDATAARDRSERARARLRTHFTLKKFLDQYDAVYSDSQRPSAKRP